MPAPTPVSTGALVARDVAKAYADRVVLDGVDVVAHPGRALALVGENGSGKSTLLRLLAGLESPDAGNVQRPDDLGHLGQDLDVPPETTVGEVLDAALAPLHRAVARLETLAGRLDEPAVADEYAALLDWAVHHDAWDATRRAEEAAARLGLATVPRERPVGAMSGGQRSRLGLAALLVRRPDCLLLDEPTNHLDDEAVRYVEEVLRSLPGVVVVASHDRVFLDRVADQVLDLDPSHLGSDGSGARVHGRRDGLGAYSSFLADRSSARRRWEEAFVAEQDEVARLREVAATTARRVAPDRGPRDNDKFIYHSKGENVARTISRRVRDTERRLEELLADPVPKPPAPLRFSGVLAPSSGGSVRVRDLVVPGRLALDRLDVHPGERVLLTGANGSGKSTLLAALAGRLSPAAAEAATGDVQVHARRLGYLPQDAVFADPSRSALEVYVGVVGAEAPSLRSLGLVHPRDTHRPVGELSLGQQRRVALACVVARGPDLVLLDEPTNHLSLALAEELEEALQRSVGTVVVASHDRWLRGRWEGPVVGL
jgi:macrolide transport system ATP-binding/permease protein